MKCLFLNKFQFRLCKIKDDTTKLIGMTKKQTQSSSFATNSVAKTSAFGYQLPSRPFKLGNEWNELHDITLSKTQQSMQKIKSYLSGNNQITTQEAFDEIDLLSENLCAVIDAADACRNLHPNQKTVESSISVVNSLNNLIHELNTDDSLSKALDKLVERKSELQSDEAIQTAKKLQIENQTMGSNLPIHLKPKAIDLQNEISQKG